MPDASRELKILITGDASGVSAASQQTIASLDGIKRSAAGLATAPPDLDAMVAAEERLAQSAKDAEAALAAEKEQQIAFRKATRGLGTEVNLLGRELGGFAGLDRSFMNPYALGLIVTTELVVKLISHFQKLSAETEKLAEAQDKLDVNIFDAQEKAANSAADAADRFNATLEKTAANLNAIKQAESERKAVQDQENKNALNLIDAHEKAELAAIEKREKADEEARRQGGLTAGEAEFHARYQSEKDAVRDRYSGRRTRAGFTAEAGDLAGQESNLRARRERQAALEAAARAAEGENENNVNNPQAVDDELTLADRIKKRGELREKIDKGFREDPNSNAGLDQMLAENVKNNQEIARLTNAVAQERSAREAAAARLREAEAARDENTAAINTETAAILKGVAVLNSKINGAAISAGVAGDKDLISFLNQLLDLVNKQAADIQLLSGRLDVIRGIGSQN